MQEQLSRTTKLTPRALIGAFSVATATSKLVLTGPKSLPDSTHRAAVNNHCFSTDIAGGIG